MKMLNEVQLIGRVGKEPELKYGQSGTAYLPLSIATETSKKVGDKWEKETIWHYVVCFKDVAVNASQVLSKGCFAFVTGNIRYRKYTDKNGVEKITTEIVANRIGKITEKEENTSSAPEENTSITEADLPF